MSRHFLQELFAFHKLVYTYPTFFNISFITFKTAYHKTLSFNLMSLSLHTRKSIYCLLMGLFFCSLTAQNKESVIQKVRDSIISQIVKDSTGNTSKLEVLLFDHIKTDSTLLFTKLDVAVSLYKSRQYARSAPYFEEVITLSRKQKKNKTLAKSYFYLGNVHLRLWQNQKALEAYYAALDVDFKKESNDNDILIQTNIAMILRRMRQSEQAYEVCKKALDVIPETIHYRQQNHINLITITCDALMDIGDWEQLRTLTAQGLKLSQDIGYTNGLIDIQTKLGALAIQDIRYNEAEVHLNKARSILDASGIENEVQYKNIRYFTALKDYKTESFEAAIDGLESIVQFYNEAKFQNELIYIESTRLLAASYKEIQDQEKSIYYYEKYTSLNDEYQLKKSSVVSSIYDKETSILGEQIESLETRTFLNIRYKWLIFSLLCITLIGFVIYFYRFKIKQSKSSNHLKKLTKKIERLESKREEVKILKLKKEVNIDDETTRHILKGLARLETQEFYLKTDCSLRSMARKVKTNATYLSHIINHHRKQSFNEYINDLRIEYALKRMQEDRKFRSFSVKSIAREVGYKSDYSFSKHFKAKTGNNPSQYIKQIKDLKISS